MIKITKTFVAILLVFMQVLCILPAQQLVYADDSKVTVTFYDKDGTTVIDKKTVTKGSNWYDNREELDKVKGTPENENEMFVDWTLANQDTSTFTGDVTTFDEDTVWLSIDQMSELFQRDRSVIGKHVRNIFKEGELVKESVWAKFAYTAADGKVYNVDFYNLDVIISVGYRVKSKRGTQFRIWATNILKEYMKKGFVMDDERLKELGGGGYFKELIDRIRDIRASEKVFYRQVLEIYATSIDYDPKAEISIQFFKKVQNKIHYAIHGQTAAEWRTVIAGKWKYLTQTSGSQSNG